MKCPEDAGVKKRDAVSDIAVDEFPGSDPTRRKIPQSNLRVWLRVAECNDTAWIFEYRHHLTHGLFGSLAERTNKFGHGFDGSRTSIVRDILRPDTWRCQLQ